MVSFRYLPLGFWRYCNEGRANLRVLCSGFTLIEIIIVAVILVIAAMTIIPLASSAASMQIRSAANMIAADLEYAKSMAISRQKIYAVVFDESTESYQIEDPNGIVNHPVKKGFIYKISFSNDNRLSKVDIADVNFVGTPRVEFDYLGSPNTGGVISLQADDMAITINVEPVTGFITITD
jgi:prepilin-type N-terminal cleavage/methylation domain-containing protein